MISNDFLVLSMILPNNLKALYIYPVIGIAFLPKYQVNTGNFSLI